MKMMKPETWVEVLWPHATNDVEQRILAFPDWWRKTIHWRDGHRWERYWRRIR